jgi:hypothetical protein
MTVTISEVTRRAIFDYFVAGDVSWSGRLEEAAFLSRLYDLNSNAMRDIHQHRVNNYDWDDDWVFFDPRFDLLRSSDDEFLRFLCETVHPVVRIDPDEARRIAEELNDRLRADGWQLMERSLLSGRPDFASRRLDERAEVFEEPTGWDKVDRQLAQVRESLETADSPEEFQAVGLVSREVLISLAQEVYDPAIHIPLDVVRLSVADATRILQAYFDTTLRGRANEEAHAHAKTAFKLAVALQHKRTADHRTAAMCAEGIAFTVNLVAILSGKRE